MAKKKQSSKVDFVAIAKKYVWLIVIGVVFAVAIIATAGYLGYI